LHFFQLVWFILLFEKHYRKVCSRLLPT
jgi:hypothetical protein